MSLDRIKEVQGKLQQAGWDRIVGVQSEKTEVAVYLKTRAAEAVEGLVATVLEGGRQAVLVNIVGNITPEQLALVGQRLNIEPLKKISQAVNKS